MNDDGEWKNLPDNIFDYFGFVYLITGPTGRKYIGKKVFMFEDNKKIARKPTKVELKKLGKLKNKDKKKYLIFKKNLINKYKGVKKTIKGFKESDWKSYYGSNKYLTADVERLGKDKFKREILVLCKTKWDCSYQEAKLQFDMGVLFDDNYYNGIINCRLKAMKGKKVVKMDKSVNKSAETLEFSRKDSEELQEMLKKYL